MSAVILNGVRATRSHSMVTHTAFPELPQGTPCKQRDVTPCPGPVRAWWRSCSPMPPRSGSNPSPPQQCPCVAQRPPLLWPPALPPRSPLPGARLWDSFSALNPYWLVYYKRQREELGMRSAECANAKLFL